MRRAGADRRYLSADSSTSRWSSRIGVEHVRYGCSTSREYALERLEAAGERDAIAGRHAGWMAAYAEESFAAWWHFPIRRWLPSLVAEFPNARAALAWLLGAGDDPVLAAPIAAALGRWCFASGQVGEAREWIALVAARMDGATDDAAMARLWLALGQLSWGERRAEVSAKASAVFAREGDLLARVAELNLAGGYCQTGRYGDAMSTRGPARSFGRLVTQVAHPTGSRWGGKGSRWRQPAVFAKRGRPMPKRWRSTKRWATTTARPTNGSCGEVKFLTGDVVLACDPRERSRPCAPRATMGFICPMRIRSPPGQLSCYAMTLGDLAEATEEATREVLRARVRYGVGPHSAWCVRPRSRRNAATCRRRAAARIRR